MGLGGSIALIAIGLILAFAVNVSISGLDLHLIGVLDEAPGQILEQLFHELARAATGCPAYAGAFARSRSAWRPARASP